MARFDRRKIYPEVPVLAADDTTLVTARTIVPIKKGGVIKISGQRDLSVNRAVGKIQHPYLWNLNATKMDSGGTSRQFNSYSHSDRHGRGVTANERVIFSHNFGLQGVPDNLVACTALQVGRGMQFTNNSGGSNFGFTFDLTGLPTDVKLHASIQKISGTFVNWEGVVAAGVVNQSPGTAEIAHREINSSLAFNPSGGDGAYGITGVTTVGLGDVFICNWFAITTQKNAQKFH